MIRVSRRAIAALLIVLLTACHSWRPTSASPQQLISEEGPSSIRVLLSDGRELTLTNLMMRDDSIVIGRTQDGTASFAVREVRRLEVRRFSTSKTVGLSLLTAVGVTTGVYLYALSTLCDRGTCN